MRCRCDQDAFVVRDCCILGACRRGGGCLAGLKSAFGFKPRGPRIAVKGPALKGEKAAGGGKVAPAKATALNLAKVSKKSVRILTPPSAERAAALPAPELAHCSSSILLDEASQASTVGQLPDLGRARGPSAHEDALHAAVLTATEVSERAPSRGPSFSRPMGKSISQTHMSL